MFSTPISRSRPLRFRLRIFLVAQFLVHSMQSLVPCTSIAILQFLFSRQYLTRCAARECSWLNVVVCLVCAKFLSSGTMCIMLDQISDPKQHFGFANMLWPERSLLSREQNGYTCISNNWEEKDGTTTKRLSYYMKFTV